MNHLQKKYIYIHLLGFRGMHLLVYFFFRQQSYLPPHKLEVYARNFYTFMWSPSIKTPPPTIKNGELHCGLAAKCLNIFCQTRPMDSFFFFLLLKSNEMVPVYTTINIVFQSNSRPVGCELELLPPVVVWKIIGAQPQ